MSKSNDAEVALIRLPEAAFEGLASLIRNRNLIPRVVEAAAKESPAGSVLAFSTRVASKNQLEPTIVAEISPTLWNLKNLQSNLGVDERALVEALTRSIEVQSTKEWRAENLDAWQETREVLQEALKVISDDHPLMVSAKANSLAYTHQNLLITSKVITDVRPVFDKQGKIILETVISHLLAIDYRAGPDDQRMIALALDQKDMALLQSVWVKFPSKGAFRPIFSRGF